MKHRPGLQTGLAVGVGLAAFDLVQEAANELGRSSAGPWGYVAAGLAATFAHFAAGPSYRDSESNREGPVSRE